MAKLPTPPPKGAVKPPPPPAPPPRKLRPGFARALAILFGKYQVFTNEHIDGEVRGWLHRGILHLDLRDKDPSG